MGTQLNNLAPAAALGGSMRDYRVPQGQDLLERVGAFFLGKTCAGAMACGHFPVPPKRPPPRYVPRATIAAIKFTA